MNSHAENLAIIQARHDKGRERAREHFEKGVRVVEDQPDLEADNGNGAYCLALSRLICAEIHDQSVCCSEHYHHVGSSIRFLGSRGSSCPVCREGRSDG